MDNGPQSRPASAQRVFRAREPGAPRPRRAGNGCLLGLVVLQGFALFAAFCIILALIAAAFPFEHQTETSSMGADEYPALTEVWSCGSGDTKVVRIPLRGMILIEEDRGFFPSRAGSAAMALRAIRRATRDPEVRGIIMNVDSGGGGITASDILYQALQDFKATDRDRRVVTLMGDVAASGAYYVALASDRILAHPTTVTGSIGVLMQTLNIRELGDRIGIKDVTIKSGKNKDILNPLTDVTDEQRQMLQGLVNTMHDRFVSLVVQDRNLPEATVRELADGQVFVAPRAQDTGLIDGIGYWDDAVATTAELLGVEDVKVYRYEQAFSFSSFFRSFADLRPTTRWIDELSEVRFLYLFRP